MTLVEPIPTECVLYLWLCLLAPLSPACKYQMPINLAVAERQHFYIQTLNAKIHLLPKLKNRCDIIFKSHECFKLVVLQKTEQDSMCFAKNSIVLCFYRWLAALVRVRWRRNWLTQMRTIDRLNVSLTCLHSLKIWPILNRYQSTIYLISLFSHFIQPVWCLMCSFASGDEAIDYQTRQLPITIYMPFLKLSQFMCLSLSEHKQTKMKIKR